MSKLLSVIIPTRNRQFYAFEVIQQILELDVEGVEIVVQDNSDSNDLKCLIEGLSASNVKYNYTAHQLSFVDNFSKAIELASGDYLTIIGDDDFITPDIVTVAQWAKENGIEAVKPEYNAVYRWPAAGVIKNGESDDGILNLYPITGKFKIKSPKKELKKLLLTGGQYYQFYDLVKLYHGIVKRSKLQELKNKVGVYVGGLSPDIYLSVALSTIIEKLVVIDYPLTVSGICKGSGSADSAIGKHTGKLSDAPHFIGHENYQWAQQVPHFYSVETIWADSALAALDDLKYPHRFNSSFLNYLCLKLYPQFSAVIGEKQVEKFPIKQCYILNGLLTWFITKAVRRLNWLGKPHAHYSNVSKICMSYEILKSFIKENNIKLKTIKLS